MIQRMMFGIIGVLVLLMFSCIDCTRLLDEETIKTRQELLRRLDSDRCAKIPPAAHPGTEESELPRQSTKSRDRECQRILKLFQKLTDLDTHECDYAKSAKCRGVFPHAKSWKRSVPKVFKCTVIYNNNDTEEPKIITMERCAKVARRLDQLVTQLKASSKSEFDLKRKTMLNLIDNDYCWQMSQFTQISEPNPWEWKYGWRGFENISALLYKRTLGDRACEEAWNLKMSLPSEELVSCLGAILPRCRRMWGRRISSFQCTVITGDEQLQTAEKVTMDSCVSLSRQLNKPGRLALKKNKKNRKSTRSRSELNLESESETESESRSPTSRRINKPLLDNKQNQDPPKQVKDPYGA